MSTPTLSSLVPQLRAKIDLQWVAQPAAERALPGTQTTAPGQCLAGRMNFVQPNCLQVLGQTELSYLNSLSAVTLSEMQQQLLTPLTLALVFSEGITPDATLVRLASEHGIAVLRCNNPAEETVDLLLYCLRDLVVNHIIVHGVFMEVIGIGVLITGPSGIGKSELALELLSRGHRLIADDAPQFTHSGPNAITGSCPQALQDFIEVRGLGILNVRAMFGDSAIKRKKDLRLVVELQEMTDRQLAQVERVAVNQTRGILGVQLPLVTIPVAPGRNLAIIVESAARNQILLNKGYNAAEAFSRQQRSLMGAPSA